jgi:lipooligosaccharide transport system ATP-binding protein
VVAANAAVAAELVPWLATRGLREPATVLGDWHVPLSAEALAEFARAFPHLRYEVRVPTLDDLFLKLALEP